MRITRSQFNAACDALGLDPDDVVQLVLRPHGGEVTRFDPANPGEGFLRPEAVDVTEDVSWTDTVATALGKAFAARKGNR